MLPPRLMARMGGKEGKESGNDGEERIARLGITSF